MGRISFVEIGIALQQVENKKNEKDPRNRKKNFFLFLHKTENITMSLKNKIKIKSFA